MHASRFSTRGLFLHGFLASMLVLGMIVTASAQPKVAIQGYTIDVRGQEPVVPKELEAADGQQYK
ncbi:MAG TPA: hypothetical protein DCO77_11525, partial [Nitrospiraceae bacterium]|nr:hypothetical protein [Nitrospiraceae bacterium]